MNVYFNDLTISDAGTNVLPLMEGFSALYFKFVAQCGISEIWCTEPTRSLLFEHISVGDVSHELRSLLLKRFRNAAIDDEEQTEEYDEAVSEMIGVSRFELRDEGQSGRECRILGWASLRDSLTLGVPSASHWENACHEIVPILTSGMEGAHKQVYCLTALEHLDIAGVQDWCDVQKSPLPLTSRISVGEKKCILSDHHGTNVAQSFAKKILSCEYVNGIKSTDYSRNPSTPFISKLMPSGVIRVCLYWERLPYQFFVYTTAVNRVQLSFVAEKLKERFDHGRRADLLG